jgi:hypothetical protein
LGRPAAEKQLMKDTKYDSRTDTLAHIARVDELLANCQDILLANKPCGSVWLPCVFAYQPCDQIIAVPLNVAGTAIL